MKTIVIENRMFKACVTSDGIIITDIQSGLTKTITKRISISSMATLRVIIRKQFNGII